ncbi:hypothetical protein TRFO_11774 [Tritrichomonas foetus]|uniref:Uncharacterized protein n=1 Tax=Tritrichomonas foetus TaxID=1144522 RepID=A0A1J4J250_9EUKA|nr:hypothetical protein TRFO_11774 [Tritrichomonas foetus]|eukprot:OHS93550.1 hypothetical protein TRFO_11774 [Tritrichomonas foetus]
MSSSDSEEEEENITSSYVQSITRHFRLNFNNCHPTSTKDGNNEDQETKEKKEKYEMESEEKINHLNHNDYDSVQKYVLEQLKGEDCDDLFEDITFQFADSSEFPEILPKSKPEYILDSEELRAIEEEIKGSFDIDEFIRENHISLDEKEILNIKLEIEKSYHLTDEDLFQVSTIELTDEKIQKVQEEVDSQFKPVTLSKEEIQEIEKEVENSFKNEDDIKKQFKQEILRYNEELNLKFEEEKSKEQIKIEELNHQIQFLQKEIENANAMKQKTYNDQKQQIIEKLKNQITNLKNEKNENDNKINTITKFYKGGENSNNQRSFISIRGKIDDHLHTRNKESICKLNHIRKILRNHLQNINKLINLLNELFEKQGQEKLPVLPKELLLPEISISQIAEEMHEIMQETIEQGNQLNESFIEIIDKLDGFLSKIIDNS